MKSKSKIRRFATILLFPLLAPMFMVGFVACIFGERSGYAKKNRKKDLAKQKPETCDFQMEIVFQDEKPTISN